MDHFNQKTNETPPRSIRVFISSTFKDMQDERDELVKQVFPQIGKLCEARGVAWGYVDLRWGVSDEMRAEGRVLPVCLEEIRRCRPYFIGLLGERYGWIPDELPQELVEREPWLAGHNESSVTELEILHGVLNDPAMADHAFFYFRDPAYAEGLPDERRAVFQEGPTEAESRLAPAETRLRVQKRQERLSQLKARIRQSGLPVRENYPDPRALGEWVLADLKQVLDQNFPEATKPDELARERADQEAFALSRRQIYLRRPAAFDRLDAQAGGKAPPLTVLGEAGIGKSALLASWAQAYRAAHPQELVLTHFIGASPFSADWKAMLRRIIGELQRHFGFHGEIPSQTQALRGAFANALAMAAAQGRVVLILDGLNQLEDQDGAAELAWLPPVLPENLRLILSSLPGRSLEELQRRAWPTYPVEPLDVEDRTRLITLYLAEYGKTLNLERTRRIANAPQTANPLYLRLLLDELRLFGVHERLEQSIEHYLGAAGPGELAALVLERWEQDYQRDRPGLVAEALSLLWAARKGLSETELLDLLGEGGTPLPRAFWSPLFLAADQSLISQGGRIEFGHAYLRQAVEARYLVGASQKDQAHARLAAYFQASPLNDRQVDELPWQLARQGDWEGLRNVLADIPFLNAGWKMDGQEVLGYWAQVTENSPCRVDEVYRERWPLALQADVDVGYLGGLLTLLGYPDEARQITQAEIEKYRASGQKRPLASSLFLCSELLRSAGRGREATAALREATQIYTDLGDQNRLTSCLGSLATFIFDFEQDPPQALRLLQEQEQICRANRDVINLQGCLGNQANIQMFLGRTSQAQSLSEEAVRICKENGVAVELPKHALLFAALKKKEGKLEEALQILNAAETDCRSLGLEDTLAACLGQAANTLGQLGRFTEDREKNIEAEACFRRIQDTFGLTTCLYNQGLCAYNAGNVQGTSPFDWMSYGVQKVEEALKIMRRVGPSTYPPQALARYEYLLSALQDQQ